MPARSSLPPLVEPAAELSREEVARYSRHLIIPDIGTTGQKRLKNARVLVIGAGGLGSPTLMYLAAAGVGTIGIVDLDVVDESNLQRQVIHGTADVGRSKVLSARESIREINPHVDVRAHEFRLDASNAVGLFEQYDLILDGADNFATRYLVNDAAVLAHRPYVWGSIYRFQGQVSVFWEDPPEGYGVTGTTLRDLYPEAPPPGTVPSCAEGGVLGVLCAAVGSIMATEAIKLITGIGESLLGRLIIHDALTMNYRTVTLSRDPGRVPVTELVDYEEFCGVEPAAEAEGGWAISPLELRELIDSGADIAIVDVREPVEWDIVHLPGATLIPKDRILSGEALAELPKDKRIVLHCKTGIRSAEALVAVRRAGFADAVHLQGGVLAWAHQVDPSLPVY
ncbi:adenylyltransferase/sulfurtransferase MoeZ [Rhodococcus xishaensis]|uniref:Probable adenylyltransferase/sulfurtransferase MoeZ n=1 Tax=Rhodococcus xishaensis TaxID=2487364 RepID=A0A3S3AJ22_9NOCA|nr:adenylyltransferase/sulfurtransferase MoeZ [Rhodococcus xishaensis]RVW05812.1 adenylyltransferase/sulfurtransferase MoeZ [Rhodococcus xishaensis]